MHITKIGKFTVLKQTKQKQMNTAHESDLFDLKL